MIAPRALLTVLVVSLGAPAPAFALGLASPPIAYSPAPLPLEQALFAPLPQHDPRIAGGLSLLVTGAGQFYNHQSEKGWWMLAPFLLYPVAWLADSLLDVGYARGATTVLLLGTKAYSVWDATQNSEPAMAATP